MKWIILQNEDQLHEIKQRSNERPQVIFKYSSRCGISGVAKGRLEKVQIPENIDFYFLDLITYRSLSNKIAEEFNVSHESPQVLLVKNGQCIYDESHLGISMKDIVEALD